MRGGEGVIVRVREGVIVRGGEGVIVCLYVFYDVFLGDQLS